MKGSDYVCLVISMSFLLHQVEPSPIDLSPSYLFDSLRNVTVGASSFISNSIQKQTEIIRHATETATGYVSNAVEAPKRMFNNAKNATKVYIDSTASRGMEIKVRSLMEVLRGRMPYGVPALNLPVLEPLTLEHIDFHVDNKDFGNISGSVDNVTISQLSTFVVDRVELSVIDEVSLALNLSVPTIRANGMYRVSGKIGKLFAVNGSGPFNLEANGAHCYVHTVLGYSGILYVKSLNLDFSVESVKAAFHHLFRDAEVDATMNKIMSELGPEILEVLKPDLRPKLEKMFAQQVNATVSRLTMGNILGILTGTSDIESFANLRAIRL